VVGAICINIDINYIDAYVLKSAERIAEFFREYYHADVRLDENILSKDEYRRALAGKRHFRDSARQPSERPGTGRYITCCTMLTSPASVSDGGDSLCLVRGELRI